MTFIGNPTESGDGNALVLPDRPIHDQYWLAAALCQYLAPWRCPTFGASTTCAPRPSFRPPCGRNIDKAQLVELWQVKQPSVSQTLQ